jgi:SAM-dependent methyltransferase
VGPALARYGLMPWVDRLLRRRARHLFRRLAPHLPHEGSLLDVGCGTGHNARAVRRRLPGLRVVEADVADMKLVGPPPVLFHGRLPFAAESFDCGTMLFVLHYPPDPLALLAEARRVIARRLIVIQSTHQGGVSRRLLAAREFAQGRGALAAARRLGLVRTSGAPLAPATLMDRPRLERLFADAGWRTTHRSPQHWPLMRLSRDLYVLEKA